MLTQSIPKATQGRGILPTKPLHPLLDPFFYDPINRKCSLKNTSATQDFSVVKIRTKEERKMEKTFRYIKNWKLLDGTRN